MQSHAEHFFETDASQLLRQRRSAKAANQAGHPVVLKSKLVAVLPDPAAADCVFVAEAAGTARRVNVDDGSVTTVYRGPTAPATCLALGGPGNSLLFVGSWDKRVYAFPAAGGGGRSVAPLRQFAGHADFVKAVVCGRVGGVDVLISGGADRRILVWNVETGQRLHALHDSGGGGAPALAGSSSSGHAGRAAMLAVQDLAIDPVYTTPDQIWLVSASSDPHIRRWWIRLDGAGQHTETTETTDSDADSRREETDRLHKAVAAAAATPGRTLLAHETTVYRVRFDTSDDDVEQGVDLWTASGDGTARCLARRLGFRQKRPRPGDRPTALQHGGHVRALALTDAWVVTAGRDEDLKFWDRTGADDDDDDDDDDEANARDRAPAGTRARADACTATLTGHYDEVTDLAVLADGRRLCSVSLDGTVRTWPLARAEVDALARQQRADRAKAAAGGGADAGGEAEAEAEASEAAPGMLTAEEDAELAALMED